MIGILATAAFAHSAMTARTDTSCDRSPVVRLEDIIANKAAFAGRRVRTNGLLAIGGKHYIGFFTHENAKANLLMYQDDLVSDYVRTRRSHTGNFDPNQDFLRLQRLERSGRPDPDMTESPRYRAQMVLCGRVVKAPWGFGFAVDDWALQKSYLLPRKAKTRR